MSYTVYIDDNFHYMDEDERVTHGVFETREVAIAAARAIADRSLLNDYQPGMSADELYDRYRSFGEDPFIRSDEPGVLFSAWQYARARCAEICAGGGS